MQIPLRQSTAQKVVCGPFVDVTDGFTAETGVTLDANSELIKADGAAVVDISGRTWAHLQNGLYNISLLDTDTDTAGRLVLGFMKVSEYRIVRVDCIVHPAEVYDSLYGTDKLQVDLQQITGDATFAATFAAGLKSGKTFTVQASSTATVIKTNLTETADDHWNNRNVYFLTGALAGQFGKIANYDGTTKDLTLEVALTGSPAAAVEAVIF